MFKHHVWFQFTDGFDKLPGNIRRVSRRRNAFLCSVISDFRCGYSTVSSFPPTQLLISEWEMFACWVCDRV